MAFGNWITDARSFMGGMAKDLLKRIMPADKYLEAENVTIMPQQEGVEGGLTPALGTTFSITRENINIENDADDYKGFRVQLDLGFNIPHLITYTIPSSPPVTLNISSVAITASLRYADLISQINADAFLEVYVTPTLTSSTVGYVGVQGFGSDFTLTEQISSVDVDVFIIKEFYGVAGNGRFALIKSLNIGDNLYQIESNGAVFKLSVTKQDRVADTWQYVTLAQTNTIQIPIDAIIDLDGEINNGNKVSLYFTGSDVEPRVLYVQLQDTWVENSAMIYDETFTTLENENGYFTYDNIAQLTGLQVLENFARARLFSVSDTGGNLTTGSKMYIVRQSIGRENATSFSDYSNPIPIFVSSQSDLQLHGNVAGVFTSKSITLTIEGLNPGLYDFYELVCVENNDGALVSYIVGQYAITTFSQQVTHTGFEDTISITTAEITIAQIVIKDAGNLVITRNRLFLSNIVLAQQPDLSEWAKTIPVTTQRIALPAIGNTYTSVAEYQLVENVFRYTGYMLNEIYRYGIILYFTNDSPYRGVSQPYFLGDHMIEGSLIGTDLTNGAAGTTPTEIYVYHPRFTVDLSTATIDGVPLSELVYGYEIVRQPCNPRVLATGYAMPATQAGQPVLIDYYTAGANPTINIIYTEGPSSSRRTQISFLSPDILFGTVDIAPKSGDILLNYGQPGLYNTTVEPVGLFDLQIQEYNCELQNTAPFQHILSHGELVPFNTDGVLDINGAKLRNTVSYSFPGVIPLVYGNNQKSLAIALGDFMRPLTANPDLGFYYCQYIQNKSNPYGAETDGLYISCGYFREVIPGTSLYVDDVFGGDTFTEKNITKCNNFYTSEPTDPTPSGFRTGLSYYTQNRGNYQLRNFTVGTTGDYPYTTQSLEDWLGVDEQLEGQLRYSLSYTPTDILLARSAYNPALPFVSAETSTMRYSQLKLENSLLDSYRQFLPLDFKAFPSVHGTIRNTFSYGNAIFVMMDRFICIQQVDLQQQQTDPNNQISIIIGDGTVLGAREQELSFIGAPLKTAGYSYLSKFGKKYFVWFNPFYKKVIQYTSEGIRDLFDDNQMQSFLTQNTTYITGERQFFFCYDYFTSELLMFASAETGLGVIYDPAGAYSKDQVVYTEGGYTNKRWYISVQDVPQSSDPNLPANLYRYWKPYRQSNFVLSYNEQTNNIVSFYSYTPSYPLMPYLNTFLSSPTSLLLYQNVYEHNRFTNKFYEDNISAYVHSVFNMQNKIFKQAIALFSEINAKPLYLHFIGLSNGEVRSFSTPDDIKLIRNYWWSNVKNDCTITAGNPTGSNSTKTQKVGGEFIEAIIIFENGDQIPITISSALLKMQLKPRNFSL